jgi:hypothetical protein
VEHERVAVAARLHIQLDAVALSDRGEKGRAAILDPAAAMQPAMGERKGCQTCDALASAWGDRGLISRP